MPLMLGRGNECKRRRAPVPNMQLPTRVEGRVGLLQPLLYKQTDCTTTGQEDPRLGSELLFVSKMKSNDVTEGAINEVTSNRGR